VRNDTGVYEGGEISLYYDPMIAKLVTHAPTRLEAIDAQAKALDEFVVDGVGHNIPFLAALMQHERWRKGELSTGFIAEEYPDGFKGVAPVGDVATVVAAVAAAIDLTLGERKRRISGQMMGRIVQRDRRRAVWLNAAEYPLEVFRNGDGIQVNFLADSETTHFVKLKSDWKPGSGVWTGMVDQENVAVQVRPVANGFKLSFRGAQVTAYVYTELEAAAAKLMPVKQVGDSGKVVLCPMPGLVVSIAVKEGQEVKVGDQLAIVEAMKMENVIRAERDATVKKVAVKAGDSLAVDAVILEFA